MLDNKFYQDLFFNFESCFTGKVSEWDKIEYIQICQGLTRPQIYQLFKAVARERTDNFIVPPVKVLKKKNKLYPPTNKKTEIIYDDCGECYSTGLVCCKKIGVGNDNNPDCYTDYFLCGCNNIEKIDLYHRTYTYLIKWEKGTGQHQLAKYYITINRYIDSHYNGDYNRFTEDLKQRFNQEILGVTNRTTKTRMKGLDFQNLKEISISDKKTIAN